jgi:hypothetical protein
MKNIKYINKKYLQIIFVFLFAKLTMIIPSFIIGALAYILTNKRKGYAYPEDEFEALLMASIYSNTNILDWFFWITLMICIIFINNIKHPYKKYSLHLIFIFLSGLIYYLFLNFSFIDVGWFTLHYILMYTYLLLIFWIFSKKFCI